MQHHKQRDVATQHNMVNTMTKKQNATNALLETIRDMKNNGSSRDESVGYLMMQHAFKYDDARKLCVEVYGANGRGSADHSRAVEILIAGKMSGSTNKQIIADLCDALSWRESTAATLLAYHSYMVEYAKQIANS